MLASRRRADALESAWQIHSAQAAWIAHADAKATFSLAIQSAIIAGVVALIAANKLISNLLNWWTLGFGTGLLLLASGVIIAARVVAPVLRGVGLEDEAQVDHIYFGHVRLVSAKDLETRLSQGDLLGVVARQIVRMADIAWKKHIRVRWSIWLGISGGLVLAATAIASWSTTA